ncbi:hypothetical protein AB1Y20_014199 [Prymnesium parvum]|uniref:Uncharacterized protein n=1 Tax=Prymnesium parvum TaxID=97485 RepID=A0AB34IG46_PRYPA|mmetsp:Transcript_3373/g.8104  ORF Transcript_3373/g.8104 Transcript_3373/m.8104 type:complete len:96 (+) Transcript_3373:42-329(+)
MARAEMLAATKRNGLQVPLKDLHRPAGIQLGLSEDDAQLGQMTITEKWLEATHNQPRLLIAFSIILCGYGESPSPDEALDVFDEKDAPVGPHSLL